MILKKLVLENIRSYENVEITFPRGAVLLAGDIGSGKTSLLLGLQFALFGLQPGQKGTSLLRQGCETAYARLELEVDGNIINLERTIKKAKNGSISQDSNIITMGTTREELSTSEMKERVVSLLNYPREFIKKSNLLYKFTVYTPQEEMKAIIQERPEVRLDTLRHIFGIDRYKRIKENTQVFVQKIKESIKVKEVLVAELNLLKEKFVIENEKKIQLARSVNDLKLEHKRLDKEKQEAEALMTKNMRSLDQKKDLDAKLRSITVARQGKKDMESRMNKELLALQKQLDQDIDFSPEQLKAVTDLLRKHKAVLEEKRSAYLEVSSTISALESKKETPLQLQEDVTGLENCPTCHQKVGKDHKHKITKKTQYEIEDINRELEEKLVTKQSLAKDIEKEKDLIRDYESDKTALEQNKIKFEHQKDLDTKVKSDSFVLDRIRNEIAAFDQQISDVEEKILTFASAQEAFDESKENFQEINDLFRKKEIALATQDKELELLKHKLEELSDEIKEKEKLREERDFLRGLQDWISSKFLSMITMTEKNVMAKLRIEFSRIFSEWFSMLVPDNLSVRLDEDFTPIIANQDYELDYDFLSGGERTATALAYRLALNQVLNSMLSSIKTKDVVILDEPTDGFSTEQIDKMRDIFEQLKATQMILVSHEQKMEGFVDHVIKIKKGRTSKVEG